MATDRVSFNKEPAGENPVTIAKAKPLEKQERKNRSLILFEQSAGNVLNLRYESSVLESYYQDCSLLFSIYRHRFTSAFSILVSVVWIIYFVLKVPNYTWYIVVLLTAVAVFAILLGLSFAEDFFKRWNTILYLVLGCFLGLYSLLSFATTAPSVSIIFNLFLNIQVILLLYTLVPVRLWQAVLIASVLTILFIVLIAVHYGIISWRLLTVLILLEVAAHEVGLMHHLMSQARRRSTFLKLGQSSKLKREVKNEQESKKEMIQSLMPFEVAQEVISSKEKDDEQNEDINDNNKHRKKSERDDDSDDEETPVQNKEPRQSTQIENTAKDEDAENKSINSEVPAQPSLVHFRKFHVNQMKNVSILFADIVGFTKMSSNKTAPHLVFLLNDLFGSFDKLCELNGCEKIATLGDCYYCVCGCPKESADHAERCVEMGRSMCRAIQQFDERHNEEVNMRVGVHTGMVICGIVGTHRFKFDVWSHDVTLANEMESSGQAGRVHISVETHEFVKDIYEVEDGPEIPDIRKLKVLIEYFDEQTQTYAIKHQQDQANIKTYFVLRRFDNKPEKLIPEEQQQTTFAESNTVANDNIQKLNEDHHETSDAMLLDSKNKNTDPESLDKELVESFKEEGPEQIRSFFEPPISKITLNFTDSSMEKRYQRIGLRPHKKNHGQLTWATLRITPFVNAVVSCIFLILLIVSCFIAFPQGSNYTYSYRIGFYIALALTIAFYLIFVIPLIIDFVFLANIPSNFNKFYQGFFSWYFRNIYGILIIGMPSVLVMTHFDRCMFNKLYVGYRVELGIMLLFMLCNCTLFTIYSSWVKSLVATVIVAITIAILFCYQLSYQYPMNSTNSCQSYGSFLQTYNPSETVFLTFINSSSNVPMWMKRNEFIEIEIVIAILLTLVFIWFLNRELDISFRASFSCDHQAIMAKRQIIEERRQADWLLENIIPSYVIEEIKTTKKYSKHMEQVGVIFATIANFSDFYDEQYQGGREMLRVLNEIFADFENLLTNPKYKDVGKIKTIGACFMAASGLNPLERARSKKKDGHLYALMDFSIDLINTLNNFNQQLFNFNFELKIGYNIGDVTAGVIGTTKLLYDIWGDTVNVASRMYSTGSKGKIQVPEAVALQLEDKYDFTFRGEVEVKGKGKMRTYLLDGKKGAPKKDKPSSLKHDDDH